MIWFTVFLTVLFVALLCSKRFHDWLLAEYEKRQALRGKQPAVKLTLPDLPSIRWMIRLGVLAGVAWISFGTLYAIHTQIIPLPMAATIFNSYDDDKTKWEYNIEKGRVGDLGASHEQWSSAHGLGHKHSRYWQEELWDNWPRYLRSAVMMIAVCAGLIWGGFYFTGRKFFPEHDQSEKTDNGKKAEEAQPEPQKRTRRVRKKRRYSDINVLTPKDPNSFSKILNPGPDLTRKP